MATEDKTKSKRLAENAAKARMGKLRKKADELGILYNDDTSEEILRTAVNAAKEAIAAEATQAVTQKSPERSAGSDIAEIGKVIASEMAKAVQGMKDGDRYDRTVLERNSDPNDVGKEKSYFVPMAFWILPAKRQGGQRVLAPYGKIVFKMSSGDTVRNGDQTNIVMKAVYTTDSIKEQAHLETHPDFNRLFFPNDRQAEISSDQLRFAQKFGKQMSALSTKMAPSLYRMAAENGVHVDASMSLNTLRTNIANELAKRAVADEDRHMRNLLSAAGRENLLRGEPLQ